MNRLPLMMLTLLLCLGFASANGGNVTLSAGFRPDPYVLSYHSGGALSAEIYNERNRSNDTCQGYISDVPDHILTLNSDIDYLRVTVHSDSDTTLTIIDDDNAVYCYDDQEGFNPVADGYWEAGVYYIYVGNYSAPNEYDAYTISFSESPDVAIIDTDPVIDTNPVIDTDPVIDTNPVIDTDPVIDTGSSAGSFSLSPNFMPDPYTITSLAGGNLNADIFEDRNQSGEFCAGYIASIPDYHMTLTDAFGDLHLWIESDNDTTLVIVTPDNRVYCYDDTETAGEYSVNPSVRGAWQAGTYAIYVGNYDGVDRYEPYSLNISEIH